MADERLVRYILVGDSSGAVRAFRDTADAADAAGARVTAAGEKIKGFGRGITSAGRTMTYFSGALVGVGAVAIKQAATFDQAMTRVQTQAGATAAEVAKQGRNIQKLAAGNVGFGPAQLAEALYPIESVNLRGQKALDALTAAAKGAKIGGDDLAVTADAMAGALKTGTKDIHSAAEAMGVMDKIVGLGKMHLSDLTLAVSSGVVPEAKAMGLGFRDVGSALAAMTRQGIPADVEANRLKLTLTKMAAPTGAALKAVQSLGLGQFQLADDLRQPNGLVVALSDLNEHMVGLSDSQRNAKLSAIFGQSRGLSNIAGLLNVLPQIKSIQGQLNQVNASGFQQRFNEQLQTPQQKFDIMLAHFQGSMTKLGNALMPIAIPIMNTLARDLTTVVNDFEKLPRPVQKAAVEFAAVGVILGPMLMLTGKLVESMGSVVTGVGKVNRLLRGGKAIKGAEDVVTHTSGGSRVINAAKNAGPYAAAVASRVAPLAADFSGPAAALAIPIAAAFFDNKPKPPQPVGHTVGQIVDGHDTGTGPFRRSLVPQGTPVIILHHETKLDGRPIAESVTHYQLKRAAVR